VVAANFIGHSDIIWDMALQHEGDLLATAAADGKIKVWNLSKLESPLSLSFLYDGKVDMDFGGDYSTPSCVDVTRRSPTNVPRLQLGRDRRTGCWVPECARAAVRRADGPTEANHTPWKR
jgi:WD40 repeat protein